MHAASILSLAVTAALLGCAAESPEPWVDETASVSAQARSRPSRDLTLQSPAMPAVEVASAVELSRPAVEPGRARRRAISPKPAPAPSPEPVPDASPAEESVILVPALAPAVALADPAPVEDVLLGTGRELAPGRTVTVIPASAGASSAPEAEEGWAPSQPARGIMVGGGGDRCRPRGGVRGIGIGGRIPLGIPGRRLR